MPLRMKRNGKLFAFLRHHRHELFDDAFQEELEAMYRQTGAGKAPVPPGLMAMATIPRGYLRASDATMVELTVFELRVHPRAGLALRGAVPHHSGAGPEEAEALRPGGRAPPVARGSAAADA